jgi:hypothetical protein
MFENRMMMRRFGPKMGEVTEDLGKPHNEGLFPKYN